MIVIKGPSASGKVFGFRVSKDQRIDVGDEPVEVKDEVAACYVESGHLQKLTPEAAKEIKKAAADEKKRAESAAKKAAADEKGNQ